MDGLPTGFYTLEEYVTKYPDDKLTSGLTVNEKFYVRPINWAGGWKIDGGLIRLSDGNCLAYFDSREELENEMIRLGLETIL